MRHRSGRGREEASGCRPSATPAGAGGPTGGAQPDGTEDFTSNADVQSPYVRTLWQDPSTAAAAPRPAEVPGGGGAPRSGGRTRGNHWLDAPIRMTIEQKGNKLTIQSKSSAW